MVVRLALAVGVVACLALVVGAQAPTPWTLTWTVDPQAAVYQVSVWTAPMPPPPTSFYLTRPPYRFSRFASGPAFCVHVQAVYPNQTRGPVLPDVCTNMTTIPAPYTLQ